MRKILMAKRLLALLVCLLLVSAAIPAAAAEEETNIALGKSYTTFTEAAIENGFPKQVTDNNGELTDGNSASNVIGESQLGAVLSGCFYRCDHRSW